MLNIYEEAKHLGVEIAHHESDLYIPVTLETIELVRLYKYRSIVTRFTETTSGKTAKERRPIRTWFDIPFAYQPFWDKVEQATRPKEVSDVSGQPGAGGNPPV